MATPVEIALSYTKSPWRRLLSMAEACRQIEDQQLAGDIVECGVWKGGNIILARKLCPDRVCWLYDTFAGMVNPTKWDLTRGGYAMEVGSDAVSVDEVIQNLEAAGTYDEAKLRFVVGAVEDTLCGGSVPEQIALLRLDTDWYASTKIELEVLWPRLVKGGILIVDDYGHWQGARKAVDEFLRVPFKAIDYSAIMAVKP